MNLFVGIIVQTFAQEKEKMEQGGSLSHREKKWLNVKSITYTIVPKVTVVKNENAGPCKKRLSNIVQHKFFDSFIMICIVVNTMSLTLNWYD
jgi:hypothetical protein